MIWTMRTANSYRLFFGRRRHETPNAGTAGKRKESSVKPLTDIADRLDAIATELDAGHLVDPDDIRLEARRIRMQVEMGDEGLLAD